MSRLINLLLNLLLSALENVWQHSQVRYINVISLSLRAPSTADISELQKKENWTTLLKRYRGFNFEKCISVWERICIFSENVIYYKIAIFKVKWCLHWPPSFTFEKLTSSGGERNLIPYRRKDFPVTGIDLQIPIIGFRQKNCA